MKEKAKAAPDEPDSPQRERGEENVEEVSKRLCEYEALCVGSRRVAAESEGHMRSSSEAPPCGARVCQKDLSNPGI